jgi:hypothetical protein
MYSIRKLMSSIMFLDKRGDGVLRGQLGAKTTGG